MAMCGHCDKEVCADCKGAHMDILRREIARINSQVGTDRARTERSTQMIRVTIQSQFNP